MFALWTWVFCIFNCVNETKSPQCFSSGYFFFFYFTALLYGRKVIKMRQDILVSAVVLVLHFSLFVNQVLFWCEQSASDWQWNVADKSGGFTEDNPAKCNNSNSPRASHAPPPHTQSWPPPQSLLCTSPALLWALWLLTLCPIRMFYFFRFEHTWEEQKRREFQLSPVSVPYCLIVLLNAARMNSVMGTDICWPSWHSQRAP